MTDPDTLAAIQARHRLGLNTEGFEECEYCIEPWPCEAITLLAALDEANKERDALKAALERAHEPDNLLDSDLSEYYEWYEKTRELLK